MRKRIVPNPSSEASAVIFEGEIPVGDCAVVSLTSETTSHPIEHAFDGQRGPGATCWSASDAGEQTITIEFDEPQSIREVLVEVEELQASRTQQLDLFVSSDRGENFDRLISQEFVFSPPGTTFERERWELEREGVTHLRLGIRPDKAEDTDKVATLTTLAVR